MELCNSQPSSVGRNLGLPPVSNVFRRQQTAPIRNKSSFWGKKLMERKQSHMNRQWSTFLDCRALYRTRWTTAIERGSFRWTPKCVPPKTWSAFARWSLQSGSISIYLWKISLLIMKNDHWLPKVIQLFFKRKEFASCLLSIMGNRM